MKTLEINQVKLLDFIKFIAIHRVVCIYTTTFSYFVIIFDIVAFGVMKESCYFCSV